MEKNPDEIIDQMQIDVENLRETARKCVEDARKEMEKNTVFFDKKGGNYKQ